MNHYPHHIGDFDKSTRHLTRIERSIYRDLIELYYDTEAQIPLDLQFVCRKIIARTNEEVTAVEQVLNEFFTKTETGYYHDRCEEEIEKYRANSSQKALAGRASAAARAAKRAKAVNGCSTPVEAPLNGGPTNQEPRTKNQQPRTNNQGKDITPQAADGPDQSWFDVLIGFYPEGAHDTGKALEAASALLTSGHQIADLASAVERYRLHLTLIGKKPMPAEEFFSSPGNIAAQWDVPHERNPVATEQISRVFDHWRMRMNHPGAKLDDKRRKLISKALKLGYGEDDLVSAIDGCAKSAYHMGQNENGTVYDSLELILRNADKIDQFIKYCKYPPVAAAPRSASQQQRFDPQKWHEQQEAMAVSQQSPKEVITYER